MFAKIFLGLIFLVMLKTAWGNLLYIIPLTMLAACVLVWTYLQNFNYKQNAIKKAKWNEYVNSVDYKSKVYKKGAMNRREREILERAAAIKPEMIAEARRIAKARK